FGGGSNDAYVSKLDPSGTALVYSTYFGGTGSDEGNDLAVDPAGEVFVTGSTGSTGFPLASALQFTLRGFSDADVFKLSASGALAYSTYLGGNAVDIGHGIAVNAGGVYITGETSSTDFPS